MVALYPDLEGDALASALAAKDAMVARARAETRLPDSEIIVRSLVPTDTGLTGTGTWATGNLTTANTDVNIVAANTIADNRYIALIGFSNNEALGEISLMTITRKGSTARYYHVDGIRLWKHNTGWWSDPVIIDQNTTLTLALQARVTSTIASFGWHGITVEKRGISVNPQMED